MKRATEMIFLSRDSACFCIINRSCNCHPALVSNQEEADMNVILHSMNVIKTSKLGVVLRSPSGNIDITVLAVALIDDRNKSII